jgi:hypothetical protein
MTKWQATVAALAIACLHPGVAQADVPSPDVGKPAPGLMLLFGGLGTFATSYATTFFVGYAASDDDDSGNDAMRYAMVPVVGPVVAGVEGDASDDGWALLGALTAVQGIGVLMMMGGAMLSGSMPDDVALQPTADGFRVRF